ncbi:hypothetical protein EV13_2214 [Prochlorococcus sp. MIT 0702]|nr:hypothetical protein EV12_3030 [Prochlorococcus sp. MIT 0701]KGG27246.1 hypothetical protein EV13_2214 [Prochlorococcus sp. MIT 0702]KGG34419.1 hypothetical protein EV14_1214 [Prochlorococcus sp. MIT 0703]
MRYQEECSFSDVAKSLESYVVSITIARGGSLVFKRRSLSVVVGESNNVYRCLLMPLLVAYAHKIVLVSQ